MKSSKLSIASLSLSCASLILGLYGMITAISGVVCGHMALKHIKNDPVISGVKKAKAGLIIGYAYVGINLVFFFGAMIWVAISVMQKEEKRFPRPEAQSPETQNQTSRSQNRFIKIQGTSTWSYGEHAC